MELESAMKSVANIYIRKTNLFYSSSIKQGILIWDDADLIDSNTKEWEQDISVTLFDAVDCDWIKCTLPLHFDQEDMIFWGWDKIGDCTVHNGYQMLQSGKLAPNSTNQWQLAP